MSRKFALRIALGLAGLGAAAAIALVAIDGRRLGASISSLEAQLTVAERRISAQEEPLESVSQWLGAAASLSERLSAAEGRIAAQDVQVLAIPQLQAAAAETMSKSASAEAQGAALEDLVETRWLAEEEVDSAILDRLTALEESVSEAAEPTPALRVAFFNAESAFAAFTEATADLRKRAADEQAGIVELQRNYAQGALAETDYRRQLGELNVGLLRAELEASVGVLDRMLASDGFATMRVDLQQVRDDVQPRVEEIRDLFLTSKVADTDSAEFRTRLEGIQSAYEQLDALLTRAATLKIQQAATDIALQQGFDLVFVARNVIAYANEVVITDITDLVKSELKEYL